MIQKKKQSHERKQEVLIGTTKLDLTYSFDPQQFENPNEFSFTKGETLIKQKVGQQLKNVQTDSNFLESIMEICWQKYGLQKNQNQATDQECQRIHEGAMLYSQKKTIKKMKYCCEDLLDIQYLTYDFVFFFFFLKLLLVNGIVITLVFSVPAMYWYGQGDRYLNQPLFGCASGYCQFVDRYSMYNEAIPDVDFVKLQWIALGIIMAVQFVFAFAWKFNKQIRDHLKFQERISENALILRALPQGIYNETDVLKFCQKKYEAQLKKQFNTNNNNNSEQRIFRELNFLTKQKYRQSLKVSQINNSREQVQQEEEQIDNHKNHFKIRSIQVIYDFRQPRQMVKNISTFAKEIWDFLQWRTHNGQSVCLVTKPEEYKNRKKKILDLFQALTAWRTKFLEDAAFRKTKALGSTILHFKNRQDRDFCLNFLKKHYQTGWIISWGSFQPSEKVENAPIEAVNFEDQAILNDYKIKVGLAPEPENIQWLKVEHTYDEWKGQFVGCRFVMVIVPIIYAACQVGLQILKTYLLQSTSPSAIILSYLVSVAKIVVNSLLWVFLDMAVSGQEQKLITSSDVYKNYAGFASITLSLILATLMVNYWFKGVYFGSKAVVGSVFDYHLTSALTVPVLNIVGFDQIGKNLFLKVQCLRNFWMRRQLNKKEGDRLKSIYQFYSSPQFEISSAYSQLMTSFLHAAFFFMLVPIIVPFYILQVLLLYWASKLRLLKFCRFPKLIRRWLIGIIFANLLVSTVFMAGGSLLSFYAFDKNVLGLNHTPVGLYLLFAWTAIFGMIALFIDKMIENKKLFERFYPEDKFENLQGWDKLRGKPYPSTSISYFAGNNALVGLGFEKAILGTVHNRKAQELLELFCKQQVSRPSKRIRQRMAELVNKGQS